MYVESSNKFSFYISNVQILLARFWYQISFLATFRHSLSSNIDYDIRNNFEGANNDLKSLYQFLKTDNSFFKRIFLPSYSPHSDGIWEL